MIDTKTLWYLVVCLIILGDLIFLFGVVVPMVFDTESED